MSKIIVIGGGPAGIMAAIKAAENGANVILFEKMNRIGRKLAITGKGRCNLTNAADIPEIIKNIPGNGKFLHSALRNFTPENTINFFEKTGLKTKVERGNRVFPESDKAADVIEVLTRKLAMLGVEVRTNAAVNEIVVEERTVSGVLYSGKFEETDAIILATGGLMLIKPGLETDIIGVAIFAVILFLQLKRK